MRKLSLSSTSRRHTMVTLTFGISIPIADFPGIGASIRTPVAAMANAISSERFSILFTLMPSSSVSS